MVLEGHRSCVAGFNKASEGGLIQKSTARQPGEERERLAAGMNGL
jgi:hypothetical protein